MPVLLRNLQRAIAVDSRRLEKTAEAVLAAARCHGAELGLLLVSNRRIRALNARYRNKDSSTDVLSFPLQDAPPSKVESFLLGDVVIAVPTAKRQASELGHSLHDEIIRLVIHGVVHLLGFDHERGPRDAARMARKERAIFGRLRRAGVRGKLRR